MAESIPSIIDLQCDKTANIDLIFDFVANHEYSVAASKNIKTNIRTFSAKYVARTTHISPTKLVVLYLNY